MMRTTNRLASFAIILATLFWGLSFAFIKSATSSINIFSFLTWRFGLASIILLLLSSKNFSAINRQAIFIGFVLGLSLAGTVIFQTIGLQYTPASTASFITSFAIITVNIIECMLNRTLPNKRDVLAITLSIIGIALVTLSDGLSINVGDLWILLCALSFATLIVLASRVSGRQNIFIVTTIQMITVTLLSFIICLFISHLQFPASQTAWTGILLCVFLPTIAAFLLQIHYQQYLSATKTAIIFSLEPIFATITAMIYLGEKINITFIFGGALVVAAILLARTTHQ